MTRTRSIPLAVVAVVALSAVLGLAGCASVAGGSGVPASASPSNETSSAAPSPTPTATEAVQAYPDIDDGAAYEAYCNGLVPEPPTSEGATVTFAGADYVRKTLEEPGLVSSLIASGGGVVCAWGIDNGPVLMLAAYGSLGAVSQDDAVARATQDLTGSGCGGDSVTSGVTPAGYDWVASGTGCEHRTEWVVSDGHWAMSDINDSDNPAADELGVVANAPDFS